MTTILLTFLKTASIFTRRRKCSIGVALEDRSVATLSNFLEMLHVGSTMLLCHLLGLAFHELDLTCHVFEGSTNLGILHYTCLVVSRWFNSFLLKRTVSCMHLVPAAQVALNSGLFLKVHCVSLRNV